MLGLVLALVGFRMPKKRTIRRPVPSKAGKAQVARRTAPARRARKAVGAPALRSLTVVGIGASAGGLEAVTRLLQRLSPDTGLSYVVVQHLAPNHESVLPELLGASTALPVVQARQGMPLLPNRVHVIPPNVQMTALRGTLHLAPRPHDRSQYTPIDTFFRSLAEHGLDRVVGIVLSGSAADGAMGLREIKNVGGITFAQDPKTAKHDGMPRAAIATGAVDLVLPPERIADELARLGLHPFISEPQQPSREVQDFITDKELETLFYLLRSASGVDFSQYKQPTIRRRLQRRMALQRTSDAAAYLKLLAADPAEVRHLYRDILIHVTRFFRDPESYDSLKRLVFPTVVEDAGGKRPVRIWVPGCASGEEAYSIAIALLEHLGDDANTTPIQIFATDVSEDAVDRARAGIYPESIAADVSAERLRRYFTRADGHYRISKLVRDCCIFARQDLTRDPPFSKLDVIVCRNVLIYLGPRLQRQLMGLFHYALKPKGFLVLGATESVGGHGELFSVIEKRHKIYTRRVARTRTDFEYVPLADVMSDREAPPAPASARNTRHADLQSDITRVLINRYSPPAVVVDSDFQIVQTRGKTGPYLELAAGDASLHVLKMAREGLLHDLRAGLQESRKHLKPVRRQGLLVRTNGTTREVDLQIVPVTDASDTPHFVVLFEPPAHAARPLPRSKGAQRKSTDRRVEQMEQELSSSRDYLQAIIQDLEAANEELQSANEEILSSNEELQSTNEELDTAKEELQSTNEELNTVNEELNARNDELSHVNSDLINLLSAVPAAVVIVSSDLRIRRFTPLAEHILNLIPTDVGRPLGDIRPNLDAPDLEELTREVIDSVAMKELEATDRSGRRYAVRIRPYKNQEQRIDGAVLAFADLDEVSRTTALGAVRDFAQAFADTLSIGLLVLSDDLRIQSANQSILSAVGSSVAAVRGRPLRDVRQHQWDNPTLITALEGLRATGEPVAGLPLKLLHPRTRDVLIDARRIIGSGTHEPFLVVTVQDRGGRGRTRE